MDAAIGLAAEFLRCHEAHNLRSSGKALSASLPLVERSSIDSRICEHAQLGLAANDKDVKVLWGSQYAVEHRYSPYHSQYAVEHHSRDSDSCYSVGFSIDSDGHWHEHRNRDVFDYSD